MNKEVINITSKDGAKLHGVCWGVEAPKAILCLVHGMGEHCERYEHVAEYFNNNDITVFAYDQRGHGQSEGKRGHTPSYEILLDDVEELLKVAREAYNDLPIVLYGHSFGGNIVANYLLTKTTSEIYCALISSPWLRLTHDPPVMQMKMAKLFSKILPALTLPNGLDVNDISTDQEVVNAYSTDSLIHDKISTRMFTEVYKAGLWAIAHADRLKTPTLVFHGSIDNITSPKGSEKFANKAGDLAEFKLWEGMKHETHNELNKEEVIAYMYNWIQSRVSVKQ